jgi:hypothetical protein
MGPTHVGYPRVLEQPNFEVKVMIKYYRTAKVCVVNMKANKVVRQLLYWLG